MTKHTGLLAFVGIIAVGSVFWSALSYGRISDIQSRLLRIEDGLRLATESLESQSRTLSEVIHKHSQIRDSVFAKTRELSGIKTKSSVENELLTIDSDFSDGLKRTKELSDELIRQLRELRDAITPPK